MHTRPVAAAFFAALCSALLLPAAPAHAAKSAVAPILFTQLASGAAWANAANDPYIGAQIYELVGGAPRLLTRDFASAADPAVSWDAKKILFAAKKTAADAWQIYEMNADGSDARRVIELPYDCRQPIYQSKIFYLDDPGPVPQLTFVAPGGGHLDEAGAAPAWSLYSVRFDGSGLRRLTYNPSSDIDPVLNEDGRILYSSTQRHGGVAERAALMGINLDGTDVMIFAGDEGRAYKRMAAYTSARRVVFVESDKPTAEGAGNLASVDLRRNLHSYQELTKPGDTLYYAPSEWDESSMLVSRRTASGLYALVRFNLTTKLATPVYAAAGHHIVQAKRLVPRAMLDGRSSVVEETDLNGKLYCLNVHKTDAKDYDPATVKRVRIVEGVPRKTGTSATPGERSPMIDKRLLGEFDVDADGSFHVKLPANIPVQIQTLDAQGRAVRTSAWIWVKNKENRGCIGCHEDNELSPENVFPTALDRPAMELTESPAKRRTVSFERDVKPIVTTRCASGTCHATAPLSYDNIYDKKYVEPGNAHASKLATSVEKATHRTANRLSEAEMKTIIEWIDLGAHK